MEFALDTDFDSFDKSRGEQIAFNVDGQNSSGEPYFNKWVLIYITCLDVNHLKI